MYGILNRMNTPVILRQEHNNQGYFTVQWSRLIKADKYTVISVIPAISGIFELYIMDKNKALNLITACEAWYGGLRSRIREAIDPELRTDQKERELLESGQLYVRYTTSNVLADMQDTLWFLHTVYFPHDVRVSNSGRYSKIFVKETAPDQVHWI